MRSRPIGSINIEHHRLGHQKNVGRNIRLSLTIRSTCLGVISQMNGFCLFISSTSSNSLGGNESAQICDNSPQVSHWTVPRTATMADEQVEEPCQVRRETLAQKRRTREDAEEKACFHFLLTDFLYLCSPPCQRDRVIIVIMNAAQQMNLFSRFSTNGIISFTNSKAHLFKFDSAPPWSDVLEKF